MNKGYYIASNGDKVVLEPTHTINLSGMNIIELIIPDGVKEVWCWNNNLTKLDLPDSITYINCRFNYIDELIIPDNCRVNCDHTCNVITRTMFNRSKRLKAILK